MNDCDSEKGFIEKCFSYVLSKEQCSMNELNHEVKVLELFTGDESERNIEDCICIDNNVFCF